MSSRMFKEHFKNVQTVGKIIPDTDCMKKFCKIV